MFEVTGNDVAALYDADLRTLITRLSLAELSRKGLPLAGVTAGGNQDAADGGIDVRVELAGVLQHPDFIPRQTTGFQVKKPDMSARAIIAEMRPEGVLRPVIGELANAGGSYVIVSFQGSVADKPLADRRKAMRDALAGHPKANDLHVDFYDRERIATWVNKYHGIVAWVRARVGRELSGWRPIGDWTDEVVAEGLPYLCDDKACLIDERSSERESLPILDGIARLRTALGKPRHAIRLIGLSGLGKTRLVQALFESGVGSAPLDCGLAIYTDYSGGMTPTARDMAHRLTETNQRAILVVDNCNPQTHAELARICTGNKGNVSLITVEYDVRDDEPERTEVFRLQNASPSLVEEWVTREFDHVSQIDCSRIASFSDGNFRVARALAETVRKGETLGQLKNHELFQRIFWQRNEHSQPLLQAAEDLSLLYSFDGEDCADHGELAQIGALRGVATRDLFAAAVDLGRRGVVQARGRWRAILPQAIANPLAKDALQRIPDEEFDAFCASLPARMLKSLSRRLGYLHDSPAAQRIVKRWLTPGGPLGDLLTLGDRGLEVVRNIVPVAPGAVLANIAAELANSRGPSIVAASNQARWQWIGLLKALAYEPDMFENAAMALACFVAAEPENHNTNSAMAPFGELLHLRLSGTCATPQQRRDLVRKLSRDPDPGLRRCASLALNELLQSGHFVSISHHDFGARPRNFGWLPAIDRDIYDWFKEAIALTLELDGIIDDARSILARNIHHLWVRSACENELECASEVFSRDASWIEGWLAFRAVLRLDIISERVERRERLLRIIELLKPSDLLSQARACVLTRAFSGFEIIDGEEEDIPPRWAKSADNATEFGRAFAMDEALLRTFLPYVFSEDLPVRAWDFGKGLATGSSGVGHTWAVLHDELASMPEDARNITVLGGFLSVVAKRDHGFTTGVLDTLSDDPILAHQWPWLQSHVAMDEAGIQRLVDAIDAGKVAAKDLNHIASGIVREAPALALEKLLLKIARMPDGSMLAIDILHFYLYCSKEDERVVEPALIACGRVLLTNVDFSKTSEVSNFGIKTVVETCLVGLSGEAGARVLCRNIGKALSEVRLSIYKISHVLEGIFKVQPFIALDEFVTPPSRHRRDQISEATFIRPTSIEKVEPATLRAWANQDAAARYPALGYVLPLFATNAAGGETGISQLFLAMLADAPDCVAFLGDACDRIRPRSWSGPLHLVLKRRREILRTFSSHCDPAVRAWLADQEAWLATWIASEEEREGEREKSFE